MDLAKFLPERAFIMKAKDRPSCINMNPIPTLEESLLMMKVLEKYIIVNTGVENMVTFNYWKDSSATANQLKAFFLSKIVSGAAIFP